MSKPTDPAIVVSADPMTVGVPVLVTVSGLDPDEVVNIGTGEWQGKTFAIGGVFVMGMPSPDGTASGEHTEFQPGTVTFYVKQKGNGPWPKDPAATLDIDVI